jgi:hypothetical protein
MLGKQPVENWTYVKYIVVAMINILRAFSNNLQTKIGHISILADQHIVG